MLIGAMNPCPCGFHGDERAPAAARRMQIARYASRLSGPLRDRMDLTVAVAALPGARTLRRGAERVVGSHSRRVEAARARQMARDGRLNARLQGRTLRARTPLDREARRMFDLGVDATGPDGARARPRPARGAGRLRISTDQKPIECGPRRRGASVQGRVTAALLRLFQRLCARRRRR